MRTIIKEEQHSINGGIVHPPAPIAFGGGILVLAICTVFFGNNNRSVSNTGTNISTYVNSFFYNLTNKTT